MLVLQNTPLESIELPEVSLRELEIETTVAKFDLTLNIRETEAGLDCQWQYNTDLFDDSTIERMATHWQNILSEVVANRKLKVADIPLLSENTSKPTTRAPYTSNS